jgi:hypothetical protein
MATAVASAGMLFPQVAAAEKAASPAEKTASPAAAPGGAAVRAHDVALQPGGILAGRLVDAQGTAQPGTVISVQYGEREVARTTTDAQGLFAARGLRGGQYLIVTPTGYSFYRLWAEGTAPPTAQPEAVVVARPDVVRGQFGYGMAWVDWMGNHPYLTAGTIAAAIAIPVALAANDEWDSGS